MANRFGTEFSLRPRVVASRLSTYCIQLTFSLHLSRVRFYNESKNTIAHSNNCNFVELETERKVQFSHFLESLNFDIDISIYLFHRSAQYLEKEPAGANESVGLLAPFMHSFTVSMSKLCNPAMTASCPMHPPPAVVTQATLKRPGPGHRRNVIFQHSWPPGTWHIYI